MLDRLTLDQLRILATVAETGSFSAAARKLGRVQSAISQSVQSLESTLGLPLFDREGKVPKLNDAGRVLLQDARRLIAGAETLKARAESIASDVEPELTLAVDGIFPNAVLMACIKSLSVEFPAMPVTVFTEGLGGAMQRLQEGMARLAIAGLFPGLLAGVGSAAPAQPGPQVRGTAHDELHGDLGALRIGLQVLPAADRDGLGPRRGELHPRLFDLAGGAFDFLGPRQPDPLVKAHTLYQRCGSVRCR